MKQKYDFSWIDITIKILKFNYDILEIYDTDYNIASYICNWEHIYNPHWSKHFGFDRPDYVKERYEYIKKFL